MEPTDRQSDSSRPSDDLDDAALDALLSQARWPEPDAGSTRRLAANWASVSPARRRWHVASRLAAVAAIVLLAAGVVAVIVLQRNAHTQRANPIATKPPAPPPVITSEQPAPRVQQQQPQASPLLYVADWRRPSMRERLVMSAARVRKSNHSTLPRANGLTAAPATTARPADQAPAPPSAWSPAHVAAPPLPKPDAAAAAPTASAADDDASLLSRNDAESLRRYLARVATPRTRSKALASLDGLANPPVDALLDELGNPSMSTRYAAARALGRIGGDATTATLIERVEQGIQPRETLAALLCSRDPTAAAAVSQYRGLREFAAVVRSVEVQLKHY